MAKPRSSLLSHCFPPFYACYLLKSVKSSRSTATYIGSTPNPPRRIRQHNGEITQGAWKTKKNRPWVMQMIVHGFPSRLAALQFEWAWQHPNISRHLRDEDGKALVSGDRKSRYLKGSIQVVRVMISRHPYNTWPLHVKLFTGEAARVWDDATKANASPPLPPGFTCTTELEGVDGKSGKVGSGRTGPIAVMDEQFTSSYLAKHTALLASNRPLSCSICSETLSKYAVEPLTTTLCTSPSCVSTSHLMCLAQHFFTPDPPPMSTATGSSLVPRGGHCPSCTTYILWGDIVRGCYRRSWGGTGPGSGDNEEEEDGKLFESDNDDGPAGLPSSKYTSAPKSKSISKPTHKQNPKLPKSKSKSTSKPIVEMNNSEGEIFDFEEVEAGSYSDDESAAAAVLNSPGKAGTPTSSKLANYNSPRSKSKPQPKLTQTPKHVNAVAGRSSPLPAVPRPKEKPSPVGKPSNPKPHKSRKRLPTIPDASSEGEVFDFGAVDRDIYSDDDENAIPAGRGKVPTASSLKAKAKPSSNPPSNFALMNVTRPAKTATLEPSRGRLMSTTAFASPSPSSSPPSSPILPSPSRIKARKRMAWKDGEIDFFDDSAQGDANDHGASELAREMSVLSVFSNADPPEVERAFLRGGVIELSD